MFINRLTIKWLQRISPQRRLEWAAGLFWITFAASVICTIWLAHGAFQKILMFISWWAITITCVDICVTSDVRNEEDKLNG